MRSMFFQSIMSGFFAALAASSVVARAATSERWLLTCEDLAETNPWKLSTIIVKNLLQEGASVEFFKGPELKDRRTGTFETSLFQDDVSIRQFTIRFGSSETFISEVNLESQTGMGTWNRESVLPVQMTCGLSDFE